MDEFTVAPNSHPTIASWYYNRRILGAQGGINAITPEQYLPVIRLKLDCLFLSQVLYNVVFFVSLKSLL